MRVSGRELCDRFATAPDAVWAELHEASAAIATYDSESATPDATLILPPLQYEGRFVKGLLCSSAVDALVAAFPNVKEFFVLGAFSRDGSYQRSFMTDGHLAGFHNPDMQRWFSRSAPDATTTFFLPIDRYDYCHEYDFSPLPCASPGCDVLLLTDLRVHEDVKTFCEALLLLHGKLARPIRTRIASCVPTDINWSGLCQEQWDVVKSIHASLEHPTEYVQWSFGLLDEDLPAVYRATRVVVFTALCGQKRRELSEALSCNVPVVCFADAFLPTRGATAILSDVCGTATDCDAYGLAEGIVKTLDEHAHYRPREHFLRTGGRHRFLEICMNAIPYYVDAISDFSTDWQACHWVDLAVQATYQISLHDFLYRIPESAKFMQGVEQISESLAMYTECIATRTLISVDGSRADTDGQASPVQTLSQAPDAGAMNG